MFRVFRAAAASTAMTLSLLYLMQHLVQGNEVEARPSPPTTPIDWVKLVPKKPPATRPDDIDPPTPPRPLPQKDTISIPQWADNESLDLPAKLPGGNPGRPTVETGHDPAQPTQDSPMLPIVRFQPNYPTRPLGAGLEGYVDFVFTVNRTGTVEDIKVTYASHDSFIRAASRAVAKFKYKPRIKDGKPVAVAGVETRVSFKLE